jgi:hypothetical protein
MSKSYNQTAMAKIESQKTPTNKKIDKIISQFENAKQARNDWQEYWEDCYSYVIPNRNLGIENYNRKTNHIFDATASDAVDQLSANLISELTPAWSKWFGLTSGTELTNEDKAQIDPLLDEAEKTIQSNFDRSNFYTELHQCYLDLITAGTATLLFEEAKIGELSAFKFKAVPIDEMYLSEGPSGKLDVSFRKSQMAGDDIASRFDKANIPSKLKEKFQEEKDYTVTVIEAVLPEIKSGIQIGYNYTAFIYDELNEFSKETIILKEGNFLSSPFINFRWAKVSGDTYGRSPVMKALPDIKTANKVVELVLKNASLAVTGIWLADDDGVLNPANIKLKPGAIIPKAVGSKGLTPLQSSANFDISQIVLDDLRARIRHALLVDQLAPVSASKMTATEVLERSSEMAKILGATYGRIQSELLTPLVVRAVNILTRRGAIPEITVDGKIVDLKYKSPLAQLQSNRDALNTVNWMSYVTALGDEATQAVNMREVARWLGETLNVPQQLMYSDEQILENQLVAMNIAAENSLENGTENKETQNGK